LKRATVQTCVIVGWMQSGRLLVWELRISPEILGGIKKGYSWCFFRALREKLVIDTGYL